MKQLLWVHPAGLVTDEIAPIQKRAEFLVSSVASIAAAVQQLRRTHVDVVLLSLPHDGWEADEAVKQLRAIDATVPLVVYDRSGATETAQQLSKLNVHYLGAPMTAEKLEETIHTAASRETGYDTQLTDEPWRKLLVGSSAPMREVVETIALVGNRRSTVLITGDTGTGKEIAARAIHMASSRAHLPMVAINCAALPEHLLEAELFGHTRGAFTGAVNARTGLFEQAHRSTIFLDEIGDMPLQLQAKLLRVLQEREIQRIGSSETVRVDVRVIAASNADLGAAVAQKRFRQDLFYRLNVVPLRMPPLRERLSDIPSLVDHFITKICQIEAIPEKLVSAEAIEFLMDYSWPGNVRELEHAVESAIALSGNRGILRPTDFNLHGERIAPEFGMLSELDVPESGLHFEELMANIERTLLERALFKCGGNKARAADLLHLKRTTLVSKFKALQTCA